MTDLTSFHASQDWLRARAALLAARNALADAQAAYAQAVALEAETRQTMEAALAADDAEAGV